MTGAVFPPLPGADESGRVAVALSTCVLVPERVHVRRGDPWPVDHPIVVAHPQSFRVFTPPPLTPERGS